jgi:hypothetical protein
VLVFEYVSIGELNLNELSKMGIFDPKLPPTRLAIRLAFISHTFDSDNNPTIYSEEIDFQVD